jgi:glycosyltransferase involved in cell wall biosynthesis
MTTPTPILFTIPNLDTAGSGGALWNVVSRLDRRRFAPAIGVLRRGGHLEAEIEQSGVPLLQAPFTVSPRPLATLAFRARRAARVFREHGFALWHSFHYLDDYTEPLVARFAGARAWVYTKKNMSWNRRSWYVRSLLATRVAAQNTDMLRQFFAAAPLHGRARLVPRGVDTSRFSPNVPPRLGLRAALRVPTEATVVACVAHLLPVKGQDTLVQALARVPDTFLWLAGKEADASHVAGLRALVRDLGLAERVAFLGDVRDVAALLSEVDVFVLPTRNAGRMEGCPVALLEAMSSGRACVATDVPGSRDIVEPGQSGLLVSADDVEALADRIRVLAGDPGRRADLGAAARRRVLENYAIEREVAAHEALYEEILGTSSKRSAA